MTPYLACFRAALGMALQYRTAALAGVATQLFWGLLRIVVFSAFYAGARNPAALHMSLRQVIDYVWLGQAFFALMPIRGDAQVAAMVRDGTIAYELCRPVDLYGYWLARSASQRIAATLLRAPPLALVAVLVPAAVALSPPASAVAALLFALSLLLGIVIASNITALLSVFTLHALKGEGAVMLVTAGVFTLSAMVPSPILPPLLRTIMEWSPFAAMLDLPFRLYVGQVDVSDAPSILLRQLAWAAALTVLGRQLLNAALSRVVVQGG